MAEETDSPTFTPVPVRPRHDGWTADRQRLFIQTLADTGCVSDACDAVNISPRSAYALRRRPGAEAFDRAWDHALVIASQRLTTIAFERAVYGEQRQVWHKGEVVGAERVPSDRLLIFLLKHLDAMRYGSLSGLMEYQLDDPRASAKKALPRALDRLTDAVADAGSDAAHDR